MQFYDTEKEGGMSNVIAAISLSYSDYQSYHNVLLFLTCLQVHLYRTGIPD
jgi:hypothetical protein